MNVLVHALAPLAVIVCATVMACLHVIDSAAAIALIGAATGVAVPAVARAHSREVPTTPRVPPAG